MSIISRFRQIVFGSDGRVSPSNANDINDQFRDLARDVSDLDANKIAVGGWCPLPACTYVSATTFTIEGDYTAIIGRWDKIKLTQTTVKYFYVTVAPSYDAGTGLTTITVFGGTDYTLANAAITTPFYSKIDNPTGFTHWMNCAAPVWNTTTIDNGTGGQQPGSTAEFKIDKGTVELSVTLAATNCKKNGTANFFTFSIPSGLPNIATPTFTAIGAAYFGYVVLFGIANVASATSVNMLAQANMADNANVSSSGCTVIYRAA